MSSRRHRAQVRLIVAEREQRPALCVCVFQLDLQRRINENV